jgi:hypothetical protein
MKAEDYSLYCNMCQNDFNQGITENKDGSLSVPVETKCPRCDRALRKITIVKVVHEESTVEQTMPCRLCGTEKPIGEYCHRCNPHINHSATEGLPHSDLNIPMPETKPPRAHRKIRNTRAICQTCPYWDTDTKPELVFQNAEEFRLCSRFPPEPAYPDKWNEEAAYTAVHKDSWCGEHPDFWVS